MSQTARTTRHLEGMQVTVMGLGVFGGGIAATNFLLRQGANVLISDQKTESQLSASLAQIEGQVQLGLGGHEWSHFANSDLVVLNPAIPPRNEFVQRLDADGTHRLTSEIELFCQHNVGRVIAVTGSNGKSTTTSHIGTILQTAGVSSWIGGNIGLSLLDRLDEIQDDDWVVLELSSFQLHALRRIQFRPDIAVVTNLAANHLDWHETVDHYIDSKRAVVEFQNAGDHAILPTDCDYVNGWDLVSQTIWFGDSEPGARGESRETPFVEATADNEQQTSIHFHGLDRAPFRCQLGNRFPGKHNRLNLAAAVAACQVVGVSNTKIQQAVPKLESLEYRLQPVDEIDGILFVNDGKSTTPESAIAAVRSFDRPIVLLAGGSDKGVDLSDFAATIATRCKAVALMGDVAEVLQSHIGRLDLKIRTASLQSLEESFQWAFSQAVAGDVVLLSPGCASFGWFQNYKERGALFDSLVTRLQKIA